MADISPEAIFAVAASVTEYIHFSVVLYSYGIWLTILMLLGALDIFGINMLLATIPKLVEITGCVRIAIYMNLC
jgi:hypothetical protein